MSYQKSVLNGPYTNRSTEPSAAAYVIYFITRNTFDICFVDVALAVSVSAVYSYKVGWIIFVTWDHSTNIEVVGINLNDRTWNRNTLIGNDLLFGNIIAKKIQPLRNSAESIKFNPSSLRTLLPIWTRRNRYMEFTLQL